MLIRFTKFAGKQDWLECWRDHGSSTQWPMPKQGILPHDFVHYIVEDTLNLKQGFYGIIANAVVIPKSSPPWDVAEFMIEDSIEPLQAESLVECFQAELWNNNQPSENFLEILQVSCEKREIPMPQNITEADLQKVRLRLQDFRHQWETLGIGESIEVQFLV